MNAHTAPVHLLKRVVLAALLASALLVVFVLDPSTFLPVGYFGGY